MNALMTHLRRWQEKCKMTGAISPECLMEEMEPTFRAEGYREKTADAQEKILILNLDLLGDNIVYSAFYRELRRAYPRAYITVVSKALAYSAMELCPYVNRVLRTDVLSDLSFEHNLPKVIQLCEEDLWPGRYTMTICSHWGPENKQLLNFLAYLSGAQKRIGVCSGSYLAYVPDWPGDVGDDWEMLLTDPLVTPAVLTHEAARALYAVTYLGFEIQDDRLEVWFGMEDVIKADKCLSGGVPENSIGVAIGIGSSGLSRKYPIEAYVRAMRQLLSHGPFYFVVIGGPAERADGAWIEQQMPRGTVRNLAGKTDVRTTMAVLSRLKLYLGNDTGFMHASCALGLKVVEVSREALDKTPVLTGLVSEATRFAPWRAQAIVLQPDHALGACRDAIQYGGCTASRPHCIMQIPPKELVCAVLRLLGK